MFEQLTPIFYLYNYISLFKKANNSVLDCIYYIILYYTIMYYLLIYLIILIYYIILCYVATYNMHILLKYFINIFYY